MAVRDLPLPSLSCPCRVSSLSIHADSWDPRRTQQQEAGLPTVISRSAILTWPCAQPQEQRCQKWDGEHTAAPSGCCSSWSTFLHFHYSMPFWLKVLPWLCSLSVTPFYLFCTGHIALNCTALLSIVLSKIFYLFWQSLKESRKSWEYFIIKVFNFNLCHRHRFWELSSPQGRCSMFKQS